MVSMSEKYPENEDYSGPEKYLVSNQNRAVDSIEMLNDYLEQIWHTLCCTYDATGNLPDVNSLFEGVDIENPSQAANKIVANMLLDLMENIGRFSPWYTRPTRAFGLMSIREPVHKRIRWMLAPEAVQKWQNQLGFLANAIEKNYSILKVMILVEDLMEESHTYEPMITARCACSPPRTIRLTESALAKAEILCDACMQPFSYQGIDNSKGFSGYSF